MSSPYKVLKRQVSAEVLLLGQPNRHLDVFLDPNATRSTGYARPSELLERREEFIPAHDPERGTVFVRREAIMVLTVPQDLEYDEVTGDIERRGAKSREVVVVLADGRRVCGWMDYLLPQEGARIQDHLGLKDRFLRIRNGDIVHIIHKPAIVEVSIGLTDTE